MFEEQEPKRVSKFKQVLSADFVEDVSHLNEWEKLTYYAKRQRMIKEEESEEAGE